MTNEESLGERLSALVETLVAGARAAASETASQSLKDAFQDLKTNLVDAYGLVSVQLLEEAPSDAAYQEVLREELEKHPVIADDKAVLEKASAVDDALSREPSQAILDVDISNTTQGRSASGTQDVVEQIHEMQQEIERLKVEKQAALEFGQRQTRRARKLKTSIAKLKCTLANAERTLLKNEELSKQLERVGIAKAQALRRCREVRSELKERASEADAAKRKASLLTKKFEQAATENAELGQRLRALQTASAAQLILQPLVRNWLVNRRGKRNLRLPGKAVVIGSGPLSEKEMRLILSVREMNAVPPGDPSTDVMVVGRDDWFVDDLEAQIRARGEDGLRVYSQEMLVAALSTGDDPFKSATPKTLEQFADGHPALEYLIESGFEWPEVVASGGLLKFDESGGFADQSPINALGYIVGKVKGLPVGERRNLLTKAFRGKLPFVESLEYMKSWGEPGSRIRLRRAATHIAKQAGLRVTLDSHDVAVQHWRDDLDWMRKHLYEPWMRFRWPEIGAW